MYCKDNKVSLIRSNVLKILEIKVIMFLRYKYELFIGYGYHIMDSIYYIDDVVISSEPYFFKG